jgi:photosystem II stability/assembly factor-like uncharacterized protein
LDAPARVEVKQMAERVMLLVGTKKGAFMVEGDAARNRWTLRGPFCESWPIMHVTWDPRQRAILAAGGNAWFGPAIWKSTDFGESWTHSSTGLTYGEGEEPIVGAWSVAAGDDGTVWAGVEPAGLFRSSDGGETFEHVPALRAHPTRELWQPGGGGLILHAIMPLPGRPSTVWVAISSGGAYVSEDGGATWEPRNRGIRMDYVPEDQAAAPAGHCVHGLALAANGTTLYAQNHGGVFRTDNWGRQWDEIDAGLPSDFGFPVVAHPRDPGTAYIVPLDEMSRVMPGGRGAIWRTRDGGQSWHALRDGLPQENAYLGVLRRALAIDSLAPAGVYFGTSGGHLYASRDEGERWEAIATTLPGITSVEAVVLRD